VDKFSLIFKKSEPSSKITVVVSKKVAPRAVDRNRIKRLFREAARKIQLTGEAVIIVKKNLKDLKMHKVEKLLIEKLRNLK